MNTEITPQALGYTLLKHGFEKWFRYVFKCVEGITFDCEEMHKSLFDFFERIYNQDIKRGIINIPPRSAKTVMCIYFFAYCWCHNPNCNFIYTSYSGDLAKDGARKLITILSNEKFKSMFNFDNLKEEDKQEDPINEFWSQYAEATDKITKKPIFNSKFVINELGGRVLFTQMGASITGFGAGTRENGKFTGGITIDDGNKTYDIRSAKITERVQHFYRETLLSRLNNSDGYILNVQQRLHLTNDLTAFLLQEYNNFVLLKKPLIEDGRCLLPKQYTQERVNEIKVNQYTFLSQYQQEPIITGGNIIKQSWICYYSLDELPKTFDKVYQSWDTAYKTGQNNDYSVCTTWGLVKGLYNDRYYLIDLWRGKVEYPNMKIQFQKLYEKYKPNQILIEDQSSGQSLIQDLKNIGHNKLKAIKPNKDKESRLNTISSCFSQGEVFFYDKANYLEDLENELISFPNVKHDDMVDSISQFLQYMIAKPTVSFKPCFII